MRQYHYASKHSKRRRFLIIGAGLGVCAVAAGLFLSGVIRPKGGADTATPAPDSTPALAAVSPPAATLPAATPSAPSPLLDTPGPAATPAAIDTASPPADAKPAAQPAIQYEMTGILTPEFRRITGQLYVNYTNTTGDTLYELVFHLPAGAYYRGSSPGAEMETATYPDGFSEGGIIISAVSLNGVLAYHRVSDNNMQLIVPFLREVAPGESVNALIEFVLDVPQRNARYGSTELGFQLGNCWPVLAVYQAGAWVETGFAWPGDPFYSEAAEYRVALTYPAEYTLASVGVIEQEKRDGAYKTSYISGQNAREFACMLGKGMASGHVKHADVDIYAMAISDTSLQRSLQAAQTALTALCAYLGDFPFKTLTIAQADMQNADGMEYPGMVFIQRDLYKSGNERQLLFTLYHEIAHQWFYGLVGNDQVHAPWIDEAFAAYFGLLPFQESDPDTYASLHEDYFVRRASEGGRIDGALGEYENEYAYANAVYWRGARMLEELREKIGAAAFREGVLSLLRENAYGILVKQDIIAAFEKAGGMPLSEWFAAYMQAPQPPQTAEIQQGAING